MTVILTLLLLLPMPAGLHADASERLARPDTVDLAALRAAAVSRDPRAIQPELLARASRLRLEALRTERLPQLALTGQATYQSDVPSVPISLPNGTTPSAPRDQARAQIEADWAVYDGGRLARQADLERARLAEQTAGVAVTLYALREATMESFFGAVLYQAQAETLALTAEDLEARLALVRKQVEEGAALAADADAIEAELIRVRQQVEEAEADRRAALAVLSDLSGLPLGPDDVLALPDLDAEVALAVARTVTVSAGTLEMEGPPEFERFARTQQRAEVEARLAEAATRPTVSVFGQVGVGRPSPFDFLSDEVKEYGLVGLRFRWAPLDWGQARREAAAARLQADVARSDADAFALQLLRQTETARADLDRLRRALPQDERAVSLREEVVRVARRRLDEGVLLAPDYVDRLTDLAEARLVAVRHRIERAQAQARLLSTLGRYPDLPMDTLFRLD